MGQLIERFLGQVERYSCGRTGRGARSSEGLRAESVAISQGRLAQGQGVGSVAVELVVGVATPRRWLEAVPAARRAALCLVDVVEVEKAVSVPWDFRMGLVVITASGHRVEGLGLAEVALLLEALG